MYLIQQGEEMDLHGRRKIYTVYDEIDSLQKNEIIDEVNNALMVHLQNLGEMRYLYKYRRGEQPILHRTKEVRPEINNKIVENHAEEIVTFKNGYFLTQPAFYVARNEKATKAVGELNEYLYRSGKQQADNKLVDTFHTVGKGILYVNSNSDEDVPYVAYALDPMNAGVVYSTSPGNEPVYAYHIVTLAEQKARIDLITKRNVYRLTGGYVTKNPESAHPTTVLMVDGIEGFEPNRLGEVNIIEYYYNSTCMSSFEAVVPLMDELNSIISNRCDGIEQFVQSLCVAINCNFEEGVTANEIRQAGMLVLKNFGEQRAEFKVLSEQLDQTQTQVTKEDLLESALEILAIPNRESSASGDTGSAVRGRNGFDVSRMRAGIRDAYVIEGEMKFAELTLNTLAIDGLNLGLTLNDFEVQVTHDMTDAVMTKAEALKMLLESGIHPLLAFKITGLFNDPEKSYNISKPFLKAIYSDMDDNNSVATMNKKFDLFSKMLSAGVNPDEAIKQLGMDETIVSNSPSMSKWDYKPDDTVEVIE